MSKAADIENEMLDEPTSRLEKPVELKDLIEKCADFSIRTTGEEELEKIEETDMAQVYSMEELEPYCLTDVLEAASDDDEDNPSYDELSRSFPLFRKKMSNLTEDGKILKMIDHESHDEKVPNEGYIVVYYHYAAYVEFVETPFDCSRLRQKRPESKTLGKGEIIPGLEMALRSMRRGEKAKFLIHPDLAFGSAGIPPRIPPQATILFDVHLIDICADVKEEYVRTRDRTFQECLELAQKFRERGNSSKKRDKNVHGAISAYKKGLQILLESAFDNDEDEQKRKKEMLHLYANLAVCYLEKNRPKMVCNMFNDARVDCSPDGENNPKLLYCSGKALRILGSYDESIRRLRKALRLKREDDNILKELNLTLEARRKYQEDEKRSCKQMFGFVDQNASSDKEDETLLQAVGSEFVDIITETLDFMDVSGRKSETLNAASYTYKEKQFIRKICAKRNFLYKTPNENTILIVKKSVPS